MKTNNQTLSQFIDACLLRYGRFPSMPEIAQAFDASATSAIAYIFGRYAEMYPHGVMPGWVRR
jgi:hypothetical protein